MRNSFGRERDKRYPAYHEVSSAYEKSSVSKGSVSSGLVFDWIGDAEKPAGRSSKEHKKIRQGHKKYIINDWNGVFGEDGCSYKSKEGKTIIDGIIRNYGFGGISELADFVGAERRTPLERKVMRAIDFQKRIFRDFYEKEKWLAARKNYEDWLLTRDRDSFGEFVRWGMSKGRTDLRDIMYSLRTRKEFKAELDACGIKWVRSNNGEGKKSKRKSRAGRWCLSAGIFLGSVLGFYGHIDEDRWSDYSDAINPIVMERPIVVKTEKSEKEIATGKEEHEGGDYFDKFNTLYQQIHPGYELKMSGKNLVAKLKDERKLRKDENLPEEKGKLMTDELIEKANNIDSYEFDSSRRFKKFTLPVNTTYIHPYAAKYLNKFERESKKVRGFRGIQEGEKIETDVSPDSSKIREQNAVEKLNPIERANELTRILKELEKESKHKEISLERVEKKIFGDYKINIEKPIERLYQQGVIERTRTGLRIRSGVFDMDLENRVLGAEKFGGEGITRGDFIDNGFGNVRLKFEDEVFGLNAFGRRQDFNNILAGAGVNVGGFYCFFAEDQDRLGGITKSSYGAGINHKGMRVELENILK